MLRTASSTVRALAAAVFGATLLWAGPALAAQGAGAGQTTAVAQAGAEQAASADAPVNIRSSQIALSRDEARLQLELAGGQEFSLAVRAGQAYLDGTSLGRAALGGALDRAWRELLEQAMETPNADLSALLEAWDAPSSDGVGDRLDRALEAALRGQTPAAALANIEGAAALDPAAQGSDSVARLLDRINELESTVDELEDRRATVEARSASRSRQSRGPFHNVGDALEGIIGLLVTMAILVGIGFATIFFGGRKYLEGVADTARRMTVRSLLVGIAGSFLVLPAFFLGIIALVISIVGIPGLLVWVPGFPLAVAVAIMLGYLGVAHAAGEAMAEYRFRGSEWFHRANSYYFLVSGVGLLMSMFFAAMVAHMAGRLLSFIFGLLMFFGCALTWAALSVGLGAVLISRGGTRPLGREPVVDEGLFAEDGNV